MTDARRWWRRGAADQTAQPDDPEGVMRLSHRLVAFHIGGIVLLLLVVLSTSVWISAQHNRLAIESSQRLVANAMWSQREAAYTLVRDYAFWDAGYDAVVKDDREWLYSSIGSSVVELGTFDLALISGLGQAPAFGWVKSSPQQGETGILPDALLDEIYGLLDSPDEGSTRSRTMFAEFDGSLWVFAVARLTPVDGRPADVLEEDLPREIHGYRITEQKLSEMGRGLLAEGLTVSDTVRPDHASIPIADFDGDILTYAVWNSPQPGASILRKAAIPLTLALGVATAISAISSLYAVRSARRLERALAVAKSADRARTEFLSNVSHELRTPMNGVLGATQLLETTDLNEEQSEFVGLLRSSANAQMSLISDLIDLSRIDSGKRRIDSVPFAPQSILNEVADMMRVTAVRKGIRFETTWDAPPDLVFVGDGQAYRQVLTNLIGNAVKFTDHGSVAIRAAATTEASGRMALSITVADTGPGIPEAALPRIFERFYQVDGSMSRLAEGTGLGLAISQKLAQSMGGDIAVSSTYGSGSTFTFTASFDIRSDAREARNAA